MYHIQTAIINVTLKYFPFTQLGTFLNQKKKRTIIIKLLNYLIYDVNKTKCLKTFH